MTTVEALSTLREPPPNHVEDELSY